MTSPISINRIAGALRTKRMAKIAKTLVSSSYSPALKVNWVRFSSRPVPFAVQKQCHSIKSIHITKRRGLTFGRNHTLYRGRTLLLRTNFMKPAVYSEARFKPRSCDISASSVKLTNYYLRSRGRNLPGFETTVASELSLVRSSSETTDVGKTEVKLGRYLAELFYPLR